MDSKNEAKTARALRRVSCGEGNACFFSVLDKGGEMPPTSLRRQKPDPKDSFLPCTGAWSGGACSTLGWQREENWIHKNDL
ncbi:hypothetical protein [Pseudomonas aeruginosa]|uniref:hypothetical protein n=1 Tax=Pseudomonas aeruginosa TaxID=287 RepID=UPI0010672ECF|nr:hypothetical protein [Pseudomonas aeruginosa]TEE72264.1 hypothetical protein IPC1495_21430 [Pseudomonas aeruginosa]HCF7419548.1 hypothetical protein [Pseudomonas aeruginosa]